MLPVWHAKSKQVFYAIDANIIRIQLFVYVCANMWNTRGCAVYIMCVCVFYFVFPILVPAALQEHQHGHIPHYGNIFRSNRFGLYCSRAEVIEMRHKKNSKLRFNWCICRDVFGWICYLFMTRVDARFADTHKGNNVCVVYSYCLKDACVSFKIEIKSMRPICVAVVIFFISVGAIKAQQVAQLNYSLATQKRVIAFCIK